MLFFQTLLGLLVSALSVQGSYRSSSVANAATTVDLGELDSLNLFFAMLGTNETQWVDITEYETPDDLAVIEAWRDVAPNTTILDTGLSGCQVGYDYCQDLTGFARIVCENMPKRFGIWAGGGSLLIYYAPHAIANWLEGLARVIRAGRDARVAYNGDNQGGSGGAPVPDSIAALAGLASTTNVRFTVPMEVPGLKKCYTSEEGTVDMKINNEYLYSIVTGELTYEASQAAFSFGASDALMARASDLDKRQTRDYTILLRSVRVSPALTVADTGCIRLLLKVHLDRSSNQTDLAASQLTTTDPGGPSYM